MRKLLVGIAFALVAVPTLAHYYTIAEIPNPQVSQVTGETFWYCFDEATSARVGDKYSTIEDAKLGCGTLAANEGKNYAIEWNSTSTSRALTHRIRGRTQLEVTGAEAQLIDNFILTANDDGTLDTEFPDGDKPPAGGTLSWNFGGSPFLSPLVLQTGTPYSHDARQYGGGTLISGATLSIVHVSGDNAATEGWAVSGNNLTHPGDNAGSGVFKLRLTSGMTTADSPNITWSYTVPVGADYSWTSADGLDNGTGAGNWMTFNGATLNANPAGDGYLQVTFPSGSEWGGISSHHAMPAFTPAGVQYDVEVVVAGGSNVSQMVAQIGLGPGFTITGTGTKTFQLIGGSGNQVLTFHANGTATAGQVWRISSITVNGETEVFNFNSATVNVNVDNGVAEIGVTRTSPSNNAATIDVVRTVGTDAIAIVLDDELSWAANEGGTKFSTLSLIDDGSVTLQLQNASVGAIGVVDEVAVTILPSAGTSEMRRPAIASWWSGGNPDLGDIPLQQFHPTAVARFARSHSAIINWIPEYVQWFGISSAQEFVDGFLNAPGARLDGGVYVYLDIESVYKEWFTTGHLAWQQATATNNWYVYLNGASGTPQDSYWASYLYAYMVTNFANRDAQGRLPTEWWADYAAGYMHNGEYGTGPAPGISGIAQDNAVLAPRRDRDWNRDGTTDDFDDPAVGVWWRQGIVTAVNRYKAANPGKKVVGNIAEFIGRDIANDYPEFCNLYDGGLLEHVIAGREFSAVEFMDTAGFVASMQAISDCLIDPNMLVLSGYPEPQFVRDHQQFRHGLAITMVITDGQLQWGEEELHYFFDDSYAEYTYDFGVPIEARKSAPTQNGMYERDYFNGTDEFKAIWIPKDASGSLSLGATYCALDGEASAWLSDGQQVTSITPPAARNGIVLRKC